MPSPISRESIIVASKAQLSCEVGGEFTMLNVQSGVYYGIEAVGAYIWSLIQEPKPLAEVLTLVLAKYDVEPAQGERDLFAFLGELHRAGLIEIKDAATP